MVSGPMSCIIAALVPPASFAYSILQYLGYLPFPLVAERSVDAEISRVAVRRILVYNLRWFMKPGP